MKMKQIRFANGREITMATNTSDGILTSHKTPTSPTPQTHAHGAEVSVFARHVSRIKANIFFASIVK